MTQKESFIDVKNMPDNEKRLLFGEPPKSEYMTTRTKRATTVNNVVESQRDADDQLTDAINKTANKKKECFLQHFVIGVNNRYKSIWDIFILFLIGYSCITSAY